MSTVKKVTVTAEIKNDELKISSSRQGVNVIEYLGLATAIKLYLIADSGMNPEEIKRLENADKG